MFQKIFMAFQHFIRSESPLSDKHKRIDLAVACLLCEVANADHQRLESEEIAQKRLLCCFLNISPDESSALISEAKAHTENSTSVFEFTDQLRSFPPEKRIALVKTMWDVAFADGKLDPFEEALIRKTAELLYVDHAQFIKTKHDSHQNSE